MMSHPVSTPMGRSLTAALTLLPGLALAHPDHSAGTPGTAMEQLFHLVTQPDHLLILAAVVGLAAWSFRKRQSAG